MQGLGFRLQGLGFRLDYGGWNWGLKGLGSTTPDVLALNQNLGYAGQCRPLQHAFRNSGLQGVRVAPLLGGSGDLISRLRTPIAHVVPPVIPLINLLTKSPDPPSRYLEP